MVMHIHRVEDSKPCEFDARRGRGECSPSLGNQEVGVEEI